MDLKLVFFMKFLWCLGGNGAALCGLGSWVIIKRALTRFAFAKFWAFIHLILDRYTRGLQLRVAAGPLKRIIKPPFHGSIFAHSDRNIELVLLPEISYACNALAYSGFVPLVVRYDLNGHVDFWKLGFWKLRYVFVLIFFDKEIVFFQGLLVVAVGEESQ